MSRLGQLSVLALWLLAGCHDRRTLLFLQLQTAAGAPGDIRRVDVQVALAGRTATVTLREKSGAALTFPTGDVIDIGAGAGALTATATAYDATGMPLGQASGTTIIASGESSALTLVFGSSDGGSPDMTTGAAPDMTGAVADMTAAAPDMTAATPVVDMAPPADLLSATVPGAPTNVLASALVLSAKVSWTAPASNGGAAIVAYTVTSSPDNVQAVAYPPATGATVNGLRQGGSYTFTVTATNGVGTGPPSAPSTPAVMPSNLALTATTAASSTFNNPSIGVYNVALINDGNIDTAVGPTDSWSNGQGTALPQSVTLGFAGTKTPTVVHLYTSVGYEMQAFDVQVGNGTTFTTVASVTGNTAAYVDVPLTPLSGTQLRVLCNTGSIAQPTIVRINELEVY